MRVLVCGGAGYIGSHMVRLLVDRGHIPVVLDNLSTGHADAVGNCELIVGDVLDESILSRALGECGPYDLVMHFCAKSLVGESVEEPHLYYENNVVGTLRLLNAMRRTGHNRLVFSSTAATYGNPETDLIDERHACNPINPYGKTKLAVELALKDFHAAYGLRSLSFRYFNACGAHPSAEIGERHDPETHLIPNILKSLLDKHRRLKVFGCDYDTPDGTCVRDYVHVCDLCEAHLVAADYLDSHDGAFVMNLGNGNGFSVIQLIRAAEKVTGRPIPYDIEGRRPGDPPTLVADAALATRALNLSPKFTSIESIIETAWRFHQTRNQINTN